MVFDGLFTLSSLEQDCWYRQRHAARVLEEQSSPFGRNFLFGLSSCVPVVIMFRTPNFGTLLDASWSSIFGFAFVLTHTAIPIVLFCWLVNPKRFESVIYWFWRLRPIIMAVKWAVLAPSSRSLVEVQQIMQLQMILQLLSINYSGVSFTEYALGFAFGAGGVMYYGRQNLGEHYSELNEIFTSQVSVFLLAATVIYSSLVFAAHIEAELKRTTHERNTTVELAQLAQNAGAPIFGVDRNCNINIWNTRMAFITGISHDMALGTPIQDYLVKNTEDPVFSNIREVFETGSSLKTIKIRVKTSKNQIRTLLCGLSARGDYDRSKNGIFAVLLVAQDVTEELLLKEEATAERHMNEYLCHEVRNPLSVALGVAEHLLSNCPPEIADDIHSLGISLQYVNDIVNDAMDFMASKEGKLEVQSALVAVKKDVLEPIVDIFEIPESGCLKIYAECDESVCMFTDQSKLKQILINLVKNSIKFVDKGYIKIACSLNPDDHTVLFAVEDSGNGIPSQCVDEIFTKYEKLGSQISQGSGLGLALTQILVSILGGVLTLDQEYHSTLPDRQGCRFVFSLPGGHPPSTSPPPPSEQAAPIAKSCHVLIVDDDPMVRMILERKILKVGPNFVFSTAGSGEEAIEMARKQSYDVVTVDFYMGGGFNGANTVTHLRDIMKKPAVIIGNSANDTRDLFLASGADAVWRKPFPCEQEMNRDLRAVLLHTLPLRILVVPGVEEACEEVQLLTENIHDQARLSNIEIFVYNTVKTQPKEALTCDIVYLVSGGRSRDDFNDCVATIQVANKGKSILVGWCSGGHNNNDETTAQDQGDIAIELKCPFKLIDRALLCGEKI